MERDWLKKKSIEVFEPDYEKKFADGGCGFPIDSVVK